MKRAGVLVSIMLMAVSAQSQPQMAGRGQPPGSPADQQFLFYEAINLVDQDSVKSRVDIPYRIDSQFFVAVRNTDASLPFPFVKRGEVLIELFDSDNVSKAREINRFEIGAQTSEAGAIEKDWYQGVASFRVPPGEYSIVVEISDLESERKHLDRSRKVIVEKFSTPTLTGSTPVFVRQAGGDTLALLNFGGNVPFGSSASIFLQLNSTKLTPDPVRVEYSITTQPFNFEDPLVVAADTIEQVELLTNSDPSLQKGQNTSPMYEMREEELPTTSAILVPLLAEKLPLRLFKLEMKISQGTLELVINLPFRMVWPEMPASLRDLDFALEALRHITREEELDSLKSGTREKRLRHFEEYWKQKDRTAGTEFNEVMVEYYRRVDYTLRAFSSIRGGDGYKSDRGRIYILYGPPTKTERSLDPAAGYQEVWQYEKQNKKFVFLDQSKSGNYVLVATLNLDAQNR